MKTVITYGTFDAFHVGHLNLLKRLRDIGDRVIVAVSTDEFNLVKNKKVLIPFEQRIQIVEAIKYVDLVISESSWDQKVNDIQKYNVDYFVMGDDWMGKFDYLRQYCEVIYLKRTENISTTEIKASLKKVLSISSQDIQLVLSVLERLQRDLE